MKTAVIGSRSLYVQNLAAYLPEGTDEIVSGGAKGIDACATAFAAQQGMRLTVFRPDYRRFGKGAPLKRNEEIVRYADYVVILWDGQSHGSRHVLSLCLRWEKPYLLRILPSDRLDNTLPDMV